jgi:hypothetical protein
MLGRVRSREGGASERHGGDGSGGDKGNQARRDGHGKLLNNSVVWLASENLAELATCKKCLHQACQRKTTTKTVH